MTEGDISCEWVPDISTELAPEIIALVDCAVGDRGTLGYVEPMSTSQAGAFVADLRRRMAAGESHVLLGRVSGKPAFLAILTLNGMPNCRHRAELSKGVVHPDFRGQQHVQRGLKSLVLRAEQLGVEQFVLDVREGSRAHRLWQNFGFESYGVLDDYARIHGTRHRGCFMVQTVASLRARLWTASPTSIVNEDLTHV